jgi:hypothetical protein
MIPVIGAVIFVLVGGEMIAFERIAPFATMGECETVMHAERARLAAEYGALVSAATCRVGG